MQANVFDLESEFLMLELLGVRCQKASHGF